MNENSQQWNDVNDAATAEDFHSHTEEVMYHFFILYRNYKDK